MIDVFNGVLLCDFFGNRLSRVTKNRKGEVVSKENRAYNRFGCLAETTVGFGSKMEGEYVVCGALGTVRPTVPSVCRDEIWSLNSDNASEALS